MHAIGEYVSASRNLDGELIISFAVDDDTATIEALTKLKGEQLAIDIKKYRPKRSLNANAYFWKLCDEIAKALKSDKDTIYLMELKNHGVYEWIEVIADAIPYVEPLYRTIDIDHYYTKPMEDEAGNTFSAKMAAIKCYIGSSEYDTKQMSELIDGAVNDAQDLGIETWSRAELENLIGRWKGPQNE